MMRMDTRMTMTMARIMKVLTLALVVLSLHCEDTVVAASLRLRAHRVIVPPTGDTNASAATNLSVSLLKDRGQALDLQKKVRAEARAHPGKMVVSVDEGFEEEKNRWVYRCWWKVGSNSGCSRHRQSHAHANH
jgi:hypothetical protein